MAVVARGDANQRLKARAKALGSEKPSMKATSPMEYRCCK